MRSPLAILIIGVSAVLIPETEGKLIVPVYIYRAPPTAPPTSNPTSTPSYQPSSRPSSKPSDQPSLRPSLESSSQPSSQPSTSPKYQTSASESAAAKPSSFGFWLVIIFVGSLLYLVFRSPSPAENALTPVQVQGNVSPVVSSTSITSGGNGNAVSETLGQAFTELSDLAEKTIFPVDVDDRKKKKFTKKKESS